MLDQGMSIWMFQFYHLCNIYTNRVPVGILMLIMFPQVIPLYPNVGYVEMNPDAIWKGFISVARGAVQGMLAAFPIFSTCKRGVNCFFVLFLTRVEFCVTWNVI